VHAGDKEYPTTVGAIDSLPEKYRDPAKQAVEDSRTSVQTDIRIQLPEAFGPDARRKFFGSIPRPDMDRLSEQKDLAMEKLRGQMEQLQQRMKELEERNREMIEKLLQKNEVKKGTSSEAPTPAPSDTKQKPAI
jgi:DNA anti-recombination protein RmuC